MKRIAYDYLFNYFGGDTFAGKVVIGASITLNIRAYKGDEEILFEDGVHPNEVQGKFFSEIFRVFFDREKLFNIEKNIMVDNMFRIMYGWDRIEAEVVGYSLDVFCGTVKDEYALAVGLPEEFQNIFVSEPNIVTEEQFRAFLEARKDDFDITDNKPAQVPSAAFLDVKEGAQKHGTLS